MLDILARVLAALYWMLAWLTGTVVLLRHP
eukprot:COSAG06_NODE_46164_length_349_cov_0.612000_2_plen_29_part_01